MLLVGQQEGHPACTKLWWCAGVVISVERSADLHMAQLMPLPLTLSCFSKIQIVFTFLVPAYPGSPGQRSVKWVCLLNIPILRGQRQCTGIWRQCVSVCVNRPHTRLLGWLSQTDIYEDVQHYPVVRPKDFYCQWYQTASNWHIAPCFLLWILHSAVYSVIHRLCCRNLLQSCVK